MKRLRQFNSITVLLAGLIVSGVIVIGTAFFVFNEREEILKREEQLAALYARVLDDSVTRTFKTVDVTLGVVAEAMRAPGGTDRELRVIRKVMTDALSNFTYLRSISILDEQGAVLISSNEMNQGRTVHLGKIAQGMEHEQIRISLPAFGRDLDASDVTLPPTTGANTWFIPVVMKFTTPSISTLYLVATVNPDFIANYFELALDEPSASAALLRYDGVMLAGTSNLPMTPLRQIRDLPVFTEFLPQKEHGVYTAKGIGDQENISAFRTARNQPVITLVQLSKHRVNSEWIEINRWLVTGGLAFEFLALALTLSAWRSVRSRERVAARLDATFTQLRENERNYRAVVDNIDEVVFRADENGCFTFINPTWTRISTLRAEDTLGKPVAGFFAAEDHASISSLIRQATAESPSVEASLPLADGKPRTVEITARPLIDENRMRIGTAGTITDVTERIAAQQRIREQLRFTEQLIEVSPLPVFIKDAKGAFLMVNRAWEVFTGHGRIDVLGRTVRDLLSQDRSELEFKRDEALLTEGGEIRYQTRISRADGAQRDVLFSKACFLDANGKVAGLVGVLADVTELKEAEVQTRIARDAAEDANRAKSEFLANMSHEIRTPLNGILGMTRLALNTPLTPEQRDYLETVNSSGESLLSIINDLLDFSKIEAGRIELESVAYDPRDLAAGILRLLALQAHGKGLELLLSVDDGVPAQCLGDPHRIRQVLINLLGNAIKFTDRGEVEVRIRPVPAAEPQFLEFAVRDTGLGLPREKTESIFNAFSQADTSTTRRYGGTGLGLAISSRLAHLMSGEITLHSTVGTGSTFILRLPLTVVSAAPAVTVSLDGKKALVIDDHPGARAQMSALLVARGAQVQSVAGVAAARREIELARGAGANYDWIFIDFRPGETTEPLRLIGEWSQFFSQRVLMLEVSAAVPAADTTVRSLRKPIVTRELDALLDGGGGRHALGAGASGGSEPTPGASILVAEDHPVNQTLIRLLLEKRGHAVTLATNGRLALEALKEKRFDLILMDLQMPDMGGLDATEKIREAEEISGGHIPIIALTARAMEGDRESCFAAGMDDYLTKPIDPDALDRALARLLRNDAI